MILSKKYKEELDKIVMDEKMRKRILHNVLNENIEVKGIMPQIKKHVLFRKNIHIVAACFTAIVCLNVVKTYPKLFKPESEKLQQEEISKDIDNKNKDLQDIEESKSYDSNENSNLNKNEDSSNIELDNKGSDNSASNSSTSSKSTLEFHTNESTEKVNSIISDNIQTGTTEKQDGVNIQNSKEQEQEQEQEQENFITSSNSMQEFQTNANNENEKVNPIVSDNIPTGTTENQNEVTLKNSNENEEANSQLCASGFFITDYNTLEEAESASNLKINSVKVLPKDFNISNISVISNEILQITYSNSEQDEITFRAGENIDNISGDYNIYKVKNIYKINGIDVQLEGNKDKLVNLVNWQKDNISYSLSSIDGIDEDIILNMIKSSL